MLFKIYKSKTVKDKVWIRVSKRVSKKTVVRNKVKRRIREIIRDLTIDPLYVVSALPGSDQADFQTLRKELLQALKKRHLIK